MKFLLVFLCLAPAAFADDFGGAMGDLFGSPLRQELHRVQYEYEQYPTRAVEGQNKSLRQRHQNFSFSTPLGTSGENNKFSLITSLADDEIVSDATIPQTGEKIPSSFWNPGVSAVYRHATDTGNTQVYSFTVSSPSDQPFARWRLVALQSNIIWRVPTNGANGWIFFVNWSNNRSYLNYIPIPGFAYFWGNSEEWKVVLGLPFVAINWTPSKKWMLTASYFPITHALARMNYFLAGKLHLFAQYKADNRNYLLFTRTMSNDRLFDEERTISGGISTPIRQVANLEISGGYSFHRDFFIGEKYRDRDDGRRLNVAGAGFGLAKLTTAF